MKVLLANPRGFCAGVNMAVETLERALHLFGAPIYVYHEIVHNQHVVDGFRSKGTHFVDSIDEVPPGSVLLFSAHGVSPQIRQQSAARNLRTIDATCPLVTKVHLEALKFASTGHTILYVGHNGHDEVLGTMGEAPESIVLIENLEQAREVQFPPGTKLACLTQTTLSVDDTRRIIETLVQRFPQISCPAKEDICYATQNRQDAVKQLVNQAELTLVIGSQNSSNSQRLLEIAQTAGRASYLIDSAEQIQAEWLEHVGTVLVTAGASAPEKIVQECVEVLRGRYGADVTEVDGRKEHYVFGLPKGLRQHDAL